MLYQLKKKMTGALRNWEKTQTSDDGENWTIIPVLEERELHMFSARGGLNLGGTRKTKGKGDPESTEEGRGPTLFRGNRPPYRLA